MSTMQVIHFLLVCLISGICCKNVHHRNPRHILWGPYTKTVIETSVVKSLIPSSCIHVDASLPPCRGVRFLRFPQFTTANKLQGPNNTNAEAKVDPIVHTTEPGWAEYFGILAPTVTVTNTEFSTTIIQDPRIVVTFAVKGCKPHEMPTDLERCPEECTPMLLQNALPTSTVPPINPTSILPTPENTKLVDIEDATSFPVGAFDEIKGNAHLEGTSEFDDNMETARATDPLSF